MGEDILGNNEDGFAAKNKEEEIAKSLNLIMRAPESVLSEEDKAILLVIAVLNVSKTFEEVCRLLNINSNECFKIFNLMQDCGAITLNSDGSWICNYSTVTIDHMSPEMLTLCGEGVCNLTEEDENFVSNFLEELEK